MQQVIEYVRWGDSLKAADVLRDGQKLADDKAVDFARDADAGRRGAWRRRRSPTPG